MEHLRSDSEEAPVPVQYTKPALAHVIAAENRAYAAALRGRNTSEVKRSDEVVEFARSALGVVLQGSGISVCVQERINKAKDAFSDVLSKSSQGFYISPPTELLPPTLTFSPSDAQVRQAWFGL